MLIDTHAHVNFTAFKADADEVIRRSLDNNVFMINVGSQYLTSKKAVAIAEKHKKGVYAAVGLHPIHAQEEFCFSKYEELARSHQVVAIGEIGLDYKQEYVSFKKKQKEVFLKQLEMAKKLSLPVIFHCRMAHEDLIKILNSNLRLRGVIHCFTGNWRQAEEYLNMGLYLGFNGIIFKLKLDSIIKKTPLERILIETDCPYLTPPQEEGRNEPVYIKHIAKKIAEIKGLKLSEVSGVFIENAKKLFDV